MSEVGRVWELAGEQAEAWVAEMDPDVAEGETDPDRDLIVGTHLL